MTRGKQTCKILKEIRQQIADKNEIEYITSECHFRGECKGTCPKCEAEVKCLEDELHKRRLLGKAASIAGISLGIAGSFAACNTQTSDNQETAMKTINSISSCFASDTTEYEDFTEGIIVPKKYLDKSYNEDHIFVAVETLPEFPGGSEELIKFIQEKLVYPKEAEEKRIEGRVIVSFVVEKDGRATNITILRGVAPMLDKEAIRIIALMPRWIPGKQNGKVVRVRYEMPIKFKLD